MINRFKKFFEEPEKDYCYKVRKLSVNYGKNNILKDISFTVDKKDIFGVVGLSGSGKSTLLKALMNFTSFEGLVDKSKGETGYCPQEDAFFDELSIKENIILFGNMTRTPIEEALKRAKKLMKELKLKEPLTKMTGQLSGGQKKRLNIILSILHDPKIVILDEPFAGLDYINRLLLWDFIKQLKSKGKTIVLTTHLLNEAQLHCNNLLIISEGHKFAMGSINDIKRSLSFQEYINFEFKYLNRDDQRRIKNYCKRRGFWVLNLNTKLGSFGLPSTSKRQNIIGMIKRLETPYEITEYRPPTLNELFMVSVK